MTRDAPVPMADPAAAWDALRGEVEPALAEVCRSGRFVHGPQLAAFERELADRLGLRHAIGCASGTDALQLILRGCGIGVGDEVITTPFTFFATIEAIVHCGARPVFVDIDPATFNLDPAGVEAVVGPATRAIVAVHLFGQPFDADALIAIAQRHRLRLIEDAAQAFGARSGAKPVGALGDAAAFSFYPSKTLGGFGDGGMVVTDDDAVAAIVRELGNHGSRERNIHRRVGLNSRLDELQAVVLRARLRRIGPCIAARQRLARRYDARLADMPGVVIPRRRAGVEHVYQQYTVLLDDRDGCAAALRAEGIETAVHYPRPAHRQPALQDRYHDCDLPVAEQVAGRCLSLPLYPELGEVALDRVVDAVQRFVVQTVSG